jgi:inner membrane protein
MLAKTHFVIGLAISLYFLSHVNHKLIFIPVVLLATFLPDIDSGFSSLGRRWPLRGVQMFTDHRGIMHSYTVCVVISLIFAFFLPVVALPFFLGYSFHLLADSFTSNGIKPFWPLKYVSKGLVRTGGSVEQAIFYTFIIINVVLLIGLFLY